MDGPFYVDSRYPFLSGDVTSVTLTAALKALMPVANIPALGGNYFNYVGKAVRMRTQGRYTTGATPGNMTLSLLWGSGADNTGTAIQSQAYVWPANQTAQWWQLDVIIRCRTIGAAGTLFAIGQFSGSVFGLAGFPAATPAASAALDLTAANVISLQALRSGSTAETMQVHDVIFESLN